MKKYITNHNIRAKEVRLINHNGDQLGIVSIEEANKLAKEQQLDLLLLSETSTPPVCKIVNFGQFLYKKKKKEKQGKKTVQVTKELKMSPKISEHDYQVRLKKAQAFLTKKYNVKLTIFFRGREIVHKDLGINLTKRCIEELKEYGKTDEKIVNQGRNLIRYITPK